MKKTEKREMPSWMREQVTEHLCGELLSYSERATGIAVEQGEEGTVRYESELLETDKYTLSYNVEVELSGFQWGYFDEGERMIAVRTVKYIQSVDYSVSIDGISVCDNDTGEEFDIPEGVVSFMKQGLSGTCEE